VNKGSNDVSQRCLVMYGSGCQIFYNRARLKPGFIVPAHRSSMPQINMIPYLSSHVILTPILSQTVLL